MTTALQLSDNGSPPVITTEVTDTAIIVEPLGGYPSTWELFQDYFTEEVYLQSVDTHIYRFVQSLCGDSGAGLLKKQSYIARLKTESGLLNFSEIDSTYNMLRFPRLKRELYDLNPDNSILTKEEWDQIELADESYQHRIKLFLEATRLGNTPEGIALAAEAATGIHTDVWENYRAFYDQFSDDVLSLPFQGKTKGTGEFVLQPRVKLPTSEADDGDTYYTTMYEAWQGEYPTWVRLTPYLLGDIVIPTSVATFAAGHRFQAIVAGTSGSAEPSWDINGGTVTDGGVTWQDLGNATHIDIQKLYGPGTSTMVKLDPNLEMNLVHVMDNIRPVGALMTTQILSEHYTPIKDVSGKELVPKVVASSSNFRLTRFVTGKVEVDWPASINNELFRDRRKGYFVEAGVEKEQKNLPLSTREKPVIHHTIENVYGYSQDATEQPSYNSATWYQDYYPNHASYHIGPFSKTFQMIFPQFANVHSDNMLRPFKAVAMQNTPLIFENSVRQ